MVLADHTIFGQIPERHAVTFTSSLLLTALPPTPPPMHAIFPAPLLSFCDRRSQLTLTSVSRSTDQTDRVQTQFVKYLSISVFNLQSQSLRPQVATHSHVRIETDRTDRTDRVQTKSVSDFLSFRIQLAIPAVFTERVALNIWGD